MKFKLVEDKELDFNNKINKKKYKKHSQSYFTTIGGDVEKGIDIFNNSVSDSTSSEISGDASGAGE